MTEGRKPLTGAQQDAAWKLARKHGLMLLEQGSQKFDEALFAFCADLLAEHNERALIVGDRLWSSSSRLMSALHVERIAENERDKAAPDMVPVFDTAIEAAHEQTGNAWRECVAAMGEWTALRMNLPANV